MNLLFVNSIHQAAYAMHLCNYKISVLLLFCVASLAAQNTFKGRIVYEHQLTLQAKSGAVIPEELLALEELKYVTYYLDGQDTLYKTIAGVDGNLKSFSLHTQDSSQAYFYGSQRKVDFSALKKGGSRIKVVKKSTDRKGLHLELSYSCYDYENSSGDIGESCYAKDLPFTLAFNHKRAAKLGFPLEKEGLLIESNIRSQLTENLSWQQTRKLILFEYEEKLSVILPDLNTGPESEKYEPLEAVQKKAKIIPAKFREMAKIKAEDSKGSPFDFSALEGRYTYLDLWASWCAPCIISFPYIQQLREKYSTQDLNVVSLSIDKEKDRAAWRKILQEKNHAWSHFIMIDDFVPALREQINMQGIPHYLILDKDGYIIVSDAPGPADRNLHKIIDQLLAENK